MTDLNKMWSALASHQPLADKKGYGKAWAKMCNDRTDAVAWDAAIAAWADADAAAAAYAAFAAADFYKRVAAFVTDAVQRIEKANKEASHE